MNRYALFAFVLFAFGFNTSACATSNLVSLIEALDHKIQRSIQQKKLVGCAVAIIADGKIVHLKPYGVRKIGQKLPIDLMTAFQLGSLSKPMTALVTAVLKQKSNLDLDTQLNAHFSWLNPQTTIKHLLSHTTGYPRAGWNNKIETNYTHERLLVDLSQAQQSTPGQTYDYHNVAFSLIERVLERLYGHSFCQLCQKTLFQPLSMRTTTCGYAGFEATKNKAWPHQKTKKGSLTLSKTLSKYYHLHVPSAAGVNANITDMAQFLMFCLEGSAPLLSKEELSAYYIPLIETPETTRTYKSVSTDVKSYYALGWRVLLTPTKRIVFHGGWLKGFMNFIAFLPDQKIGIVMLTNSESGFTRNECINFLMSIN